MALEVATYINGLVPANPVGSDPLAQADDHLRLIKSTLKNTFPNIDGPVTLTDDQINALETRVDALEASGGGGGAGSLDGAGITIVTSLPASGDFVGQSVFRSTDNTLHTWNGTAWVPLVPVAQTPNTPPAVEVVSTLPATATDGKVVFNTTDNKLYERVNGQWVEVTVTVNATQEVADGSITTAKFAQGIRPVEIVATLPTTNNSEGRLVYLTTDDKIYRFTGTSWTSGVATGDLVGTIGADQIAANAITAGKIAAGAVSADQIAAGAISTDKLAANAVTASRIAAGAVEADKIATNAITSDKISANAITAGKIAAAAIGTSQLAASAITSDKIAAGAVTAANISAGAVTATAIASNAVTADKITAGAVTVDKISSGTATVASGRTFALGTSASVAGIPAAGAFQSSTASAFGLLATSTSSVSALAAGTTASGNYAGVFYNSTTSGFTSHRTTAGLALGTMAGGFYNITSSKSAEIATANHSIYLVGPVGPFTGAHDALFSKQQAAEPGDIVVDTGDAYSSSISDTITRVGLSNSDNQKGAVGVFVTKADASHRPAALCEQVTDQTSGNVSLEYKESALPLIEANDVIVINSVGEGLINVCGLGGDIEVGDLITTSQMLGKGKKQSDDIIRSYTVAKAREAVTFASPNEVKQIACIYICG